MQNVEAVGGGKTEPTARQERKETMMNAMTVQMTERKRLSQLATLRNDYATYALANANDFERVGTNAWVRKAFKITEQEGESPSLGDFDKGDCFCYVA